MYVIIPKVSHNLWITNTFPFNNIVNINNTIHRNRDIHPKKMIILLQQLNPFLTYNAEADQDFRQWQQSSLLRFHTMNTGS